MRIRRVNGVFVAAGLVAAVLVPFAVATTSAGAAGVAPTAPTALTVNGLTQPLGTTAGDLTFGWIVNDTDRGEVQSAYQVLVGTSASDVAAANGSVWDSGKITSDESVAVSYGGHALSSATRYYWSVRTWDKDGQVSPYAGTQWFETGLLSSTDWTARWIQATSRNYVRKNFSISKAVQSARLYVTAQGMYEMHINGARVGNQYGTPATTQWDKRVLVQTYDVTSMLTGGSNAIGMVLISGHYVLNYVEQTPRTLAQLVITYTDSSTSTVGTDTTWRTATGPLTYESLGDGESYVQSGEKAGWDTASYNDSAWTAVSAPTDTITAAIEPAMTTPQQITSSLTGTVHPVPNQTNRWIVDFGKNMTALARLSVTTTSPNQTIRIRYGERLDSSTGEVSGNLVETDYFTFPTAGTFTHGEQFDIKGFRYAEIYGAWGNAPTANTLHADVVTDAVGTSQFTSADPEINAIQAAQEQTRLNTLHSVPEDNPNRERRGWGADSMVTSDEALYDFTGLSPLYDKFMADVRSTQGGDGSVWDYNPNNDNGGGYTHDVAWASTLPMITWRTYQYDGDQAIVRQNYSAVHDWISWVRSNLNSSTGLVDNSKTALIHWGDWMATIDSAPVTLLYTAIFYGDVEAATQMATLLGKSADVVDLAGLASQLADSVRSNYQNASTRTFGTDEVSNAAALAFGLVMSADVNAVVNALVAALAANNGHFAGGLLGQQLVFRALAMNGRSDLVTAYLDKTDKTSFGYMLANGPGTIWEDWDGTNLSESLDQPGVGGGPSQWAYAYLAGIQPQGCAGQGGYHDVVLAPQVNGTTSSASATLQTVRGTLSSSWNLTSPTTLTWNVTVPVNGHATIKIPRPGGEAVSISENGTLIYDLGTAQTPDAGLTYSSTDAGAVTFTAGSGTYSFVVGPATPDLALGKSVTASSVSGGTGWAPAYLVDDATISSPASLGFRSGFDTTATTPEWVTIDLGTSSAIGTVTLYPAMLDAASAYAFPVRFAIQVSDSPTFTKYKTFADRTGADVADPGGTPMAFTGQATGRYVRVYVTKLAQIATNSYAFALAEVVVQAAPTHGGKPHTTTRGPEKH